MFFFVKDSNYLIDTNSSACIVIVHVCITIFFPYPVCQCVKLGLLDLALGVARDQRNIMSCSISPPPVLIHPQTFFFSPHRNKSLWTPCRSARSASGPLWRSDWRASSVALPSWLTLRARAMIAESASWLSAIRCARLFRTFCLSIWAM